MRTLTQRLKRLHGSFVTAIAGLMMLAGFATLPSGLAQVSGSGDAAHFTYDAKASLGLKQLAVKVRNGVSIEDITYIGASGDTVPAYLVVPKGTGRFAGILWGHWLMPGAANSNRDEFLEEAVALAPSGVVSLLVDAPQARPGFKKADNPDPEARQVVDLRRGLDLLRARSDIDAARIAYVGHSWDAGIGAILDATDKRFAAFVFMSGPQSMKEYVHSDSPRMVAARKTVNMADVDQHLKAKSWADPGSYAAKLGPAPALFQYGLHDEDWVPLADAKDYVAMSSGPKTVQYYDADHALNVKARTDRDEFLRKSLHLAR